MARRRRRLGRNRLAGVADSLRASVPVAVLLLTTLLALLAQMPWMPPVARTRVLQGTVIALGGFLVYTGVYRDDPRVVWRRGPNPWLLGVLGWAAVCALLSPYRAFAAAEMLRLLLCAFGYFLCAYVLRPEQLRPAVVAVLSLGAAMAIYGFVQFGSEAFGGGPGSIIGTFGNHEELGSFLVTLFPVALALALERTAGGDRTRPLVMQSFSLVIGGALLLARTRSAWTGAIAATVALVSMTVLLQRRYGAASVPLERRRWIGPAVVVALGFGLLIGAGRIAPLVSARLANVRRITDDASLSDRLHRWRSAARMASERPLTGWGLGTFPLIQGRWTHQGDDTNEVLGRGTGHSNIAHNFWVQWAAETGGVGLALYIALLTAFALTILSVLPRVSSSFRRTLAIGSLAAVAAALVDGIGSPSYNFAGVSLLPFLWMGLAIAACREPRAPATTSTTAASPLRPIAALTVGALAAAVVLGIGTAIRANGKSAPRGTLVVTAEPPGPVPPGTNLRWTAKYVDARGRQRATAPGTIWRVTTGRLDKSGPLVLFADKNPARSGWLGTIPPDVKTVTVTATYSDFHSRPLTASATVSVSGSAAKK